MAKSENLTLDYIPLSEIDPNPENAELFRMSDIEHLANIIKEEGFTTPIEVYKKDDGRYEITSGHRRYEAMKSLGKKKIPCLICDGYSSKTKKDRKLLSSNIAFRRLSPYEFAKAIECYKEILEKENYPHLKRTKVAEYFNITESNVRRYECILKLIPELQELCKRPSFPYSSLSKAATLTKKEQLLLYNEFIRLEAETRNISEDEVDKDEIVFSRTRIEQIINNKIRAKENAKKMAEREALSDLKEDDEFPLPSPVEEEISEYGIDIIKDEDEEIIDYDNYSKQLEQKISINLSGLDQCIVTINEYSKSFKTASDKSEIKKKIAEMKKALEKLEKSL